MNLKLFFSTVMVLMISKLYGQVNYQWIDKKDSITIYQGGEKYPIKNYERDFKNSKPDNIILMIGDGMGVAQVFAGITANGGNLFLNNFKHLGFSKTQSASSYITDSAAGATALSSGVKTYNGAIAMAVDAKGDTIPVKTVLEMAEEKGLSTGLVASDAIVGATPASFIAHQKSRDYLESIAADFLKTDIDVFIGGGYDFFAERKDEKDLTTNLKQNGYQVLRDMDEIAQVKSGKLAGLPIFDETKPPAKRHMKLPLSTETALNILSNNKKGFFLMVEGALVDYGGHENNNIIGVREMLDFDQAIGAALEFASKDGKTLIIVTADHETGGLSLVKGDMQTGMVKGNYATRGHTAVMVPIFAYGPGAEQFTGIMENTDIGNKIISLLGLR